jgi:transcriptional regulator with XRE-family HTH domain
MTPEETTYNMPPPVSRTLFHILSLVPQLTVGQRLRDLRHRLGMKRGERLTQEWLAEQVGASKSSVAKWETDAQPPGPVFQLKLADLYDTTPEYIMKGVSADMVRETPAGYPGGNGASLDADEVERWLETIIAPDMLRRLAGTPTYRDVLLSALDTVARRQWPAERKTAVQAMLNRMLEDAEAADER